MKQNNYETQDVQERHVCALSRSLCADDAREVSELYAGLTPYAVIAESARRSLEPKALVLLPDTVLCCYGVVPGTILSASGQIWCLTGEELPRHALPFLRRSHMWVQEQRQNYNLLWNYVPVWHTRSLKWLRWLGFSVNQETDYLCRVELRGM